MLLVGLLAREVRFWDLRLIFARQGEPVTTEKVQAAAESVEASRRDFIRRAAYIAPAILTLAVAPSYAKAGSEKGDIRSNWRERFQELLEWLRQR